MQADRLRILFVAPFPPRLAGTHGGAKAIAELVFHTAARHDVALTYLRHAGEPEPEQELLERLALAEEITRPDEPTGLAHVVRALRRRAKLAAGTPLWVSELAAPSVTDAVESVVDSWAPDVIRLEYPVSAALLPATRTSASPVVLVDYDPLLSRAEATATGGRRRLDRALDRRAWKRFDRRSRQRVDAVVVLTERDRRIVVEAGGARVLECIPLGLEPMPALDGAGRDDTLLFVGNMNHPSNREAVGHLVEEIVPRVRALRPQATLTIVGQRARDHSFPPPTDGVRLTDLVEDVVPYLDEAAVVLAPLRTGGGMRVKVLEALSAGKAVVAYPNAVEGIEIEPGRHAVVATSAAAFAEAVVSLLADRAARERLGREARAWALAHTGWTPVLDAYDGLYRRLVERRLASGG